MNENERIIINNFYYKLKGKVVESSIKKISDEKADVKTFKLILVNTNFTPKYYMKIFNNLPEKARINIITTLGYASEDEFKQCLKRLLYIYRLEYNRRELEKFEWIIEI